MYGESILQPRSSGRGTPRRFGSLCGPRRRGGFILPMTLLLTAMTCVVSVGFARRSLRAATLAVDAERDLQRHWALSSSRRLLVGQVANLLAEPASETFSSSTARVGRTVRFGGRHWRIVVDVADEDSKLNLNFAKTIAPVAMTNAIAQRIAADSGSALEVELLVQPLPQETDVHGRPAAHVPLAKSGVAAVFSPVPPTTVLQSWGQVFRLQEIESADRAFREVIAATTQLTCWGAGRLNFHRASELAIEQLCIAARVPMVSGQIVAARNRNPKLTVSELFALLDLRELEQARLARILTDRSTTYSVALTFEARQQRSNELHIVRIEQLAAEGTAAGDDSVSSAVDANAVGQCAVNTIARFMW